MTATLGRAFIVRWRDMDRWVVPSAAILSPRLPAGWQRVPVGDLVMLVSNAVKVQPTEEYKMAGVKWYGEGVFHRETVRGDTLSAKWISPLVAGALIYNRLFAWKASFAVVPRDLADCHVSNEFPQFVAEPTKLLPEYLWLWCMADQTIKAVSAASTGSAAVSRNRFREGYFLDFEMPLPPLAVQRKIVAAWEASRKAAAATAAKIAQLEADIEARLLADLGLKAPAQATLPKCFAVWWKDLDRWDLTFQRQPKFRTESAAWPLITLREAIRPLSDSMRRLEPARFPKQEYNYIGMENVEACTGATMGFVPRKGAEIRSACVRFDRGHVLYGKLRPYLRKVVDCSELNFEEGIASSEFLVLRPSLTVSQNWLALLLRSSYIAHQAKAAIGARMPRIAPDALLRFKIPLPPLQVQRQIVEGVAKRLAEIAKLKADAKARADAAKAAVETMIVGTKPVE
jgi:type I restriction enzyme S subunit